MLSLRPGQPLARVVVKPDQRKQGGEKQKRGTYEMPRVRFEIASGLIPERYPEPRVSEEANHSRKTDYEQEGSQSSL